VRGGFNLARPAAAITVLEIVNAVDPLERIRSCPLGLAAHGARLCPLHRRLDAVLANAEAAFAATTLAEVVNEPPARAPQCRFPAGAR
jgi:DNA-binding IscR family transcriptional regulator